jgi:CheY-like chemotaxis protein
MALVILMPLHSALPIHLLILAAFGGLLLLHRRRPRPALAFSRGSIPPDPGLASAMQPPEAAAGRPPVFAPSVTSTPFPPPARGELILVIDDEPSVRDLLSTVLLNHGYQVAMARDGAEGLRLFSAMPDRISLVLSDVYMPNISGRSFADLIRPIRPDVRILLMSGLDGSEVGAEFDPANSRDPFLLKPFKPAALLQKIHQLLHPAPAPGS